MFETVQIKIGIFYLILLVFISQRLNDDDLLTSRVWQKSTESSSFVVSALSLWAAVNLIPWIFIQHIILTNFNPLNTGDVNVNVQLKTYNNEDWMNLFNIILHSIPTALTHPHKKGLVEKINTRLLTSVFIVIYQAEHNLWCPENVRWGNFA